MQKVTVDFYFVSDDRKVNKKSIRPYLNAIQNAVRADTNLCALDVQGWSPVPPERQAIVEWLGRMVAAFNARGNVAITEEEDEEDSDDDN